MRKRYQVEFEYHDQPGFLADRGFYFIEMARVYTDRICSGNDKVLKGRVLDSWQSDSVVYEW